MKKWILIPLLVFLWFATPYLMGALAGQQVRSVGTSYVDTKVIDLGLSGGTDHSLAWSVSGPVTLTLELGYEVGGTEFWVTPAEVGNSVANPIAASGADAIAIFVPVAKKARLTCGGAATGTVVFSDS